MTGARLACRQGAERPAAVGLRGPRSSAVAVGSVPGQTPGDAGAERAARARVRTDHEQLRPPRVSGTERRFGRHGSIPGAASPEPKRAGPKGSQGAGRQATTSTRQNELPSAAAALPAGSGRGTSKPAQVPPPTGVALGPCPQRGRSRGARICLGLALLCCRLQAHPLRLSGRCLSQGGDRSSSAWGCRQQCRVAGRAVTDNCPELGRRGGRQGGFTESPLSVAEGWPVCRACPGSQAHSASGAGLLGSGCRPWHWSAPPSTACTGPLAAASEV